MTDIWNLLFVIFLYHSNASVAGFSLEKDRGANLIFVVHVIASITVKITFLTPSGYLERHGVT